MVLWCFNGFVNKDIICKKTDLTLDVGNDVIDVNQDMCVLCCDGIIGRVLDCWANRDAEPNAHKLIVT